LVFQKFFCLQVAQISNCKRTVVVLSSQKWAMQMYMCLHKTKSSDHKGIATVLQKPDSDDLKDSSAAHKADEAASTLLAEEETAACQAAAKQTKKQKQKLRKQLTRQLTQQQPPQHQQQQPEAESLHVEASQAGHDKDAEPSSRLPGPAEPIQAMSTAASQPEHSDQHACCKESDTSHTCTASSQDQVREVDSLVEHPMLSEQGSQQRSATQGSSRCKAFSAQPPEPDSSAHLHAPFKQRHVLTQQEDLRQSAPHTNASIAEPASLPAGSVQAWEASVQAVADSSDVKQISSNKDVGVPLHRLLVCPLTQVGIVAARAMCNLWHAYLLMHANRFSKTCAQEMLRRTGSTL